MPANGFYFLVYEYLQEFTKKQTGSDQVSLTATLFAGGSAGIAYWVVGMPADVLKSRLQTGKYVIINSFCNINGYKILNIFLAPQGTYQHGIRSVFKELMLKEGPFALYRGFTPIIIRAFPANAACFFGIELANKAFNKIAPDF